MKLIFLLCAVIGVSYATSTSRSLRDDFDEILSYIPTNEIKAIYHKYENDPDVAKVVTYLKSEDFANVVKILESVDEVHEMVNYLESKNIHVVDLMNKIADLLGIPHYPGGKVLNFSNEQLGESRNLKDFVMEVLSVIPHTVLEVIMDKLVNSADFQEFYTTIQELDYQKLHDNALKHPEIVDMLKRVNAMGVDTKAIWDFIKAMFGWEYFGLRQTRTPRNDMDELLALIPKEKIREIYMKYRSDPDIVKVVAYLKSPDFAAVAHIVAGVPEVTDLVNYLEGKGLKVIETLKKIADLLGITHGFGSFSVYSWPRESRTWRDFINEVKSVLPMPEIQELIINKLMTSEDFQELFEKLQSLDYQKLHDNALKHPEIVDMIKRLNAMGVDTKKIWEAIKTIFGWEYSRVRQSRSLRNDMDELLALIPKEKIREIYMKYRSDPDIVKVVAYLKSPDFAAVAHIVAGVPEVMDLVNYLEGKGLKVIETLKKIADLLGITHGFGSFSVYSWPRESRTWRDFINEVKSVLPMPEIQELLINKLMTSEDFQELFEKLQSLDYQKLHDNALKHPEIVDMIKRLNAMGVDTKKIWETIKTIFGWEYSRVRQSRSLRNDMDELLALIPKEKIREIYMKYRSDPDIVKVVAYLKSPDFAAVAHIVAGVPEVTDLVNYLEGKGIKVIETLNKIADLLGITHGFGSFSVYSWPRESRTWRNFINEVKSVLPMREIEDLLINKLMTSEDFQELYQKVHSVDYQMLHDNALQHPEIVDMIKRLNAMGVDTMKIWNTIKFIFGWA